MPDEFCADCGVPISQSRAAYRTPAGTLQCFDCRNVELDETPASVVVEDELALIEHYGDSDPDYRPLLSDEP